MPQKSDKLLGHIYVGHIFLAFMLSNRNLGRFVGDMNRNITICTNFHLHYPI